MTKQLNEASLSRVWQHVQSDRPIALLTAFRGEHTYEENVARNKELAASLRKLGYGFFFLDGSWIENQGTDKEQHVSEDSIFAIGNAGDDENFRQHIVELGAKYDQDAVLVKDKDGANLYDKNGKLEFSVGSLKPGKMGSIYSRLRNNKEANVFIFESERDDLGFLDRMRQLAGIS